MQTREYWVSPSEKAHLKSLPRSFSGPPLKLTLANHLAQTPFRTITWQKCEAVPRRARI